MSISTEYDVITFDCYGTLIDWETGIQLAFKDMLRGLGLTPSEESRAFELYEKEERKIEDEEPYRSYRNILSEAANRAAERLGKTIPEDRSRTLAEHLPMWGPFSDTNPSLEKLARKYKLGILSNVDNDLIAGTLKQLTVSFDPVITAEQVRSYKPATKHFEEARKKIGKRWWLHVAASLYHDIEPATKLGIDTVWVNRRHSEDVQTNRGKIIREVTDLAQLASWLAP